MFLDEISCLQRSLMVRVVGCNQGGPRSIRGSTKLFFQKNFCCDSRVRAEKRHKAQIECICDVISHKGQPCSQLSTLISTEFFYSLSSNCKIEASSKKFVKTLITRPGKKMTEKLYANFFLQSLKGRIVLRNQQRLTSIAIKQNYAPKGTSTYGVALKSRKVNSVITHNRCTVQKFTIFSDNEIFTFNI